MTLGEGKRKVLMLLDEYSSGGSLTPDRDIDAKMNDFFDLAQKNVAGYQKIVREFAPEAGVSSAPADFCGVFRVWRDGRLTGRYVWKGRAIVVPVEDLGRVMVEYFAVPRGIAQDAPEDYPFEVSEDGAACMPYFVAAQQLMADLILDPAPLMSMYSQMLAALDTRLPGGGVSGIRQGFYR